MARRGVFHRKASVDHRSPLLAASALAGFNSRSAEVIPSTA
jgi:hypothetical protein